MSKQHSYGDYLKVIELTSCRLKMSLQMPQATRNNLLVAVVFFFQETRKYQFLKN